jgi:decaprenylphospho-beta-D-erythro-pentofuranosid-2-ulose 2-reductase
LRKKSKYRTVVLFGSTSEIGLEVVKELHLDYPSNFFLVGREQPDLEPFIKRFTNVSFIQCDFLDYSKVKKVISGIFENNPPDIALLAAGILPPENHELDCESVARTLEFNSLAMITLLSQVANRFVGFKNGTILVFSSVAAQRPRLKNFTYGASKASLDFFAVGLAQKIQNQGVIIKVLRPGYVFTRMSRDFPPAPFAITKEIAAKEIVKSLRDNNVTVYIPKKLRFFFFILRALPWYLFSKLEQL